MKNLAKGKTIKVSEEFYKFLLDKKLGKERAIEDALRRLLGYKARKREKEGK